jgi:hypothetical protein
MEQSGKSVRVEGVRHHAETSLLQKILQTEDRSSGARAAVFGEIRAAILSASPYLRQPNFTACHGDDLETLFHLYDHHIFQGSFREALQGRQLTFRISKRLTRAGGQTVWRIRRDRRTGATKEDFEISVSAVLLYQTFEDHQRPVHVAGCLCNDRLEAMQRILEHEMIHLGERLIWGNSSCRAKRFQSIAARLFGHQSHTHHLVTTTEIARRDKGIHRGSVVTFLHEGRQYQGIVNRLTRRATVLVPDSSGLLYSDGVRYTKFYVPLNLLHPAEKRSGNRE